MITTNIHLLNREKKIFFYTYLFMCLFVIAMLCIAWNYSVTSSYSCWTYEDSSIPVGNFERDGDTFSQEFTAPADGIRQLSIFLATWARKNTHDIVFRLKDATGKEIFSKTVSAASIQDNQYYTLHFPEQKGGKGKKFTLELQGKGNCSPTNSITVWSSKTQDLPPAKFNGRSLSTSFKMQLFYNADSSFFIDNIRGTFPVFVGIFCFYSIFLFIVLRFPLSGRFFRWNFYFLLFLFGIGVLMLRCLDLIAYPGLYTEDGWWSGYLLHDGLVTALLNIRPDYFVWGNVFLLYIALLLNHCLFGDNMLWHPIIVAIFQMIVYTGVSLLPVIIFRKYILLPFRILLFLFFILLFGILPTCSFDIFGKISNIGYLAYFLSFCLLYDLFMSHKTVGKKNLLYGLIIILCCFTNPGVYLLLFLFFLMECCRARQSFFTWEQNKWGMLRFKFFWTLSIYGCIALTGLIVQKCMLPGAGEYMKQNSPFTYAGVIESVAKSFSPFFSLFYTHLNTFSATLALAFVLFTFFSVYLCSSHTNRLPMFLVFISGALYLSSLLLFRPAMDWTNNYVHTFPYRYYYGITFFWILLLFLVASSALKIKRRLLLIPVFLIMGISILGYLANTQKFLINNPFRDFFLSWFHNKSSVTHKLEKTKTFIPTSWFHNKSSDTQQYIPIAVPFHYKAPFYIIQEMFETTKGYIQKKGYAYFGVLSLDSLFFMEDSLWKNCISKKFAGFYVKNTVYNRNKFLPGGTLIMPNGEKRTITHVFADRIFLSIYLTGAPFSTENRIPFETYEVLPPIKLKDDVFFYSDEKWDHGILRASAGFFVRNILKNQNRFAPGNLVQLGNGEKRKILRQEQNGIYLNIYLEGAPLSYSIVGSPSEYSVIETVNERILK